MNNIKEHLYPESEEEVIKILSENPNSQILAGGTDLTLNIDQNIETLVDLHNLPLNYITENEKGFVIGSMTTAYQISIFDKLPGTKDKVIDNVRDYINNFLAANKKEYFDELGAANIFTEEELEERLKFLSGKDKE